MPERCRTRYPLLLAHGLNCRDHWPLDYWGRIPEALRAEGAVVYLGGQDAWGSVEGNARQLQAVLLRALEETDIKSPARYRARSLPVTGALLKGEDRGEKQLSLLEE